MAIKLKNARVIGADDQPSRDRSSRVRPAQTGPETPTTEKPRKTALPTAAAPRSRKRRGGVTIGEEERPAPTPPAPAPKTVPAAGPQGFQALRQKALRSQVARLQKFQDDFPDHIRVVGPTPVKKVWTRGEPVRLLIRGIECLFEARDGQIGTRSEHPFRVEFDSQYPKKRSGMTFFYDIDVAGGVAYHPNIISPFQCLPERDPGYICLWEKAPHNTALGIGIVQFCNMLRYEEINPEPPHGELNPRALRDKDTRIAEFAKANPQPSPFQFQMDK